LFIRQDVVGAAETGSGKTLAFGLPILQRLLEEREKAGKMLERKGEEAENYAPNGLLRALIITPTRELALQVLVNALCIASVYVISQLCMNTVRESDLHYWSLNSIKYGIGLDRMTSHGF
jgi:superfamily II DNA/RNA helicase